MVSEIHSEWWAETRNRVMLEIRNGTTTTSGLVEKLADVSPDYVRVLLARLVRSGDIERITRGVYRLAGDSDG